MTNKSIIGLNPLPRWKHEQVQIVIPAGQNPDKINFPDIPNLRNVHLLGITVYDGRLTKASVLGTKLIEYNLLTNLFMTLQLYNGKQFINQEPLMNYLVQYDLANVAQSGSFNSKARDFVGQKVNFPKSYIETGIGYPPDPIEDRAVLFSIYYRDIKSVEEKDFSFEFSKQQ